MIIVTDAKHQPLTNAELLSYKDRNETPHLALYYKTGAVSKN